MEDAKEWLQSNGLLRGDEPDTVIGRRYVALSKCKFGSGVSDDAKREFLRRLVPYEDNLAAK